MTNKLYDRGGMTITTTGSGTTLSLGGALGAVASNICSWQTFATAGASNGDTLRILILDTGGAWEISTVTYSTSGPSLTGRTLEASSTGSLLSLSGSAQVFIMAGAGDILTAFNGRGGGAITPTLGDYDTTLVYKQMYCGFRPTVVSGTPVLSASETAKTSIFLTPFEGGQNAGLISLYDGTRFVTFIMAEQTITLDTTNFLNGKLYDLWVAYNSGTPFFGYGPAWTNLTTRSAAFTRTVGGVPTNSASITLRSASGTTITAAANTALLVGTAYATANGKTGADFSEVASGGGNPIVGYASLYNQVPISVIEGESVGNWIYNSSTWRHLAGSASNVISYVDPLGSISPFASLTVPWGNTTTGNATYAIGIALNWSSGAPVVQAAGFSSSDAAPDPWMDLAAHGAFAPAMGFNVLSAIESAVGGSPEGNDIITGASSFMVYRGMY